MSENVKYHMLDNNMMTLMKMVKYVKRSNRHENHHVQTDIAKYHIKLYLYPHDNHIPSPKCIERILHEIWQPAISIQS